jgi:hypothetical protein
LVYLGVHGGKEELEVNSLLLVTVDVSIVPQRQGGRLRNALH